MRKDVTIIIPHLGKTKEQKYSLAQCLLSLEETVPDIKKILVVNGNEDKDYLNHLDSQKELLFPNLTIYSTSTQGQCVAVNLGVDFSDTPWVFITNDDMIYPEGWFERLIEPLYPKFISSADVLPEDFDLRPHGLIPVEDVNAVKTILPNIACISPTLIEPRPGAPTFLTHFCGGAGGDFDLQKFKEYVGELYLTVASHIKTGFNLPFLIKKDLWNLIGGYDVHYDPWGSNSDSDLLYKIRLAGVQPVQNRAAFVYHFSQTSGTFEPQNRSFWEQNFRYFETKWGFVRTDHRIWEADFEMPDEGRIFRPSWEGAYAK